MKRSTFRLLILVLLAVLLCALAAAGQADDHKHDWKLIRTAKAPTCTEAGKGYYKCACGLIRVDTIPALGHSWGNWKTTKKATCGESGTKTRTCSACNATQTGKIKATGRHSYKWVIISKATCGKDGSQRQVCTVCGHKGKTGKIPATGKHSYGKWKVTKAATCTAGGEEIRTCSVCGKEESKEIKATGHDWDDGVVTQPAGFLESGIKTYTCKKCGQTKTEEIPAEKPKNGSIMDLFRNGSVTEEQAEGLSLKESTKLHIVVQPVNTNLHEKESVTLSCRAEGGEIFPGSTYLYAWYDAAGKQVALNDTGDLTTSEEGEYYCTAEDYAGTLLTSDTVTVYNAEPLHVIACSEDQSLKDGETVDLFVQFGGGVPPYEVEWIAQNGGDDPKTQQTADDTWSITVIGNNSNWQFFQCSATDKMGEHIHSDIIYVVPYRDPLTIVRTEFDPEVTNEKKASLFVEVADGTDPYTYTLLNDGTAQGSKSTHGTNASFSVDEPGWYAIHIKDAKGRTAQTQYMEVGDSRLRIVQQPQSVEPAFQGNYLAATFTCKAAGNPDHLLKYQWQGKGSNGWQSFNESLKNTITFQEGRTGPNYYMLHSAYRCIVRDTVTGETVTSDEAKVTLPMKVDAYPADNGKTIIVKVTGGFSPYSLGCERDHRTKSYLTEEWIPFLKFEPCHIGKRISEEMMAHSTTYTITGIKAKDRHYDDWGVKVYWYYRFTVTDSHGEKASDDINYSTD